jgi:uncharacterized alpha-E superfamily protein
MLSRVAESVYWMFRYMERAQDMARFVDADFNNLLYDPGNKENVWRSLIAVTGDVEVYESLYGGYDSRSVVRFLTLDGRYPNSVYSSLSMARENARSVREIISSEMWETLNGLYLRVRELAGSEEGGAELEDPTAFCKLVQDGGHAFIGQFYSTMDRGETWHFARLGTLLERADKTTRILDVKCFVLMPKGEAYDSMQWGALLRSASGLEMFRKAYRRVTPESVIDFLLFHEEFPRSVRHCCRYLFESLRAVAGARAQAGDLGFEAMEAAKALYSDASCHGVEEVLAKGAHRYVDELQARFNSLGDWIAASFFAENGRVIPDGADGGVQGGAQGAEPRACE